MHVCKVYITPSNSESYSSSSDISFSSVSQNSSFYSSVNNKEVKHANKYYQSYKKSAHQHSSTNRRDYPKYSKANKIPSPVKLNYVYVISDNGIKEINQLKELHMPQTKISVNQAPRYSSVYQSRTDGNSSKICHSGNKRSISMKNGVKSSKLLHHYEQPSRDSQLNFPEKSWQHTSKYSQFLNSPGQRRLSRKISNFCDQYLDEDTDDLFGSSALAPPIHQKSKNTVFSDFTEEESTDDIEEDPYEDYEEEYHSTNHSVSEDDFTDDFNQVKNRLFNIKSQLDNYKSSKISSKPTKKPMKNTKKQETDASNMKHNKKLHDKEKMAPKVDPEIGQKVKNILESYSYEEEEEQQPKKKSKKLQKAKQTMKKHKKEEKNTPKEEYSFEEENGPIIFMEEEEQEDMNEVDEGSIIQSNNTMNESSEETPSPSHKGKSLKKSLLGEDDSDSDIIPVFVIPQADEVPGIFIPPKSNDISYSSDSIDAEKILNDFDMDQNEDNQALERDGISCTFTGLNNFVVNDDDEEEEEEEKKEKSEESISSYGIADDQFNIISEEDDDESFKEALNKKFNKNAEEEEYNNEEETEIDDDNKYDYDSDEETFKKALLQKFQEKYEEEETESETFSPVRKDNDDDDLPNSLDEEIVMKIKSILGDSGDIDNEPDDDTKMEESSDTYSDLPESNNMKQINISEEEEKTEESIHIKEQILTDSDNDILNEEEEELVNYNAKSPLKNSFIEEEEEEEEIIENSLLKEQKTDLTKGLNVLLQNIGIDDDSDDDI